MASKRSIELRRIGPRRYLFWDSARNGPHVNPLRDLPAYQSRKAKRRNRRRGLTPR